MAKRERLPGEHERLRNALAGLNDSDWNSLARFAGVRIHGFTRIDASGDGRDVVQDVLLKAWEDKRCCAFDVDVKAFIINCIKSCAHQRNRAAYRDAEQRRAFGHYHARCSDEPDALKAIAEGIVKAIRAHCKGDARAQSVLESMLDEMPPRVARQELGIDKKTYDTARKRIKRRAFHAASVALAGHPNHWFWRHAAAQKRTR